MAHGEADCTVKCLWVHDGPALQAKIMGSLTTGQRVTVWQVEGAWSPGSSGIPLANCLLQLRPGLLCRVANNGSRRTD
jgi:hypothetical protein